MATDPPLSQFDARSDPAGARRGGSPASRRGFVRQVALAGASALTLVTARPALARGAKLGATPAATDDVSNLRLLLDIEHLAYALYRDAANRFREDSSGDQSMSLDRAVLHTLREVEGDHVGLLTALVVERAGPLSAIADYDFAYSDERGFLQVAAHIETAVVGAYIEAVPAMSEPWLRQVLTSLLAVDARHAAYFADQSGTLVFPQARERAASKTASRLAIDRYRAN